MISISTNNTPWSDGVQVQHFLIEGFCCTSIIAKTKEVKKMAVYKDSERGTWYCRTSYRDELGKVKVMTKRGFPRKRDALD